MISSNSAINQSMPSTLREQKAQIHCDASAELWRVFTLVAPSVRRRFILERHSVVHMNNEQCHLANKAKHAQHAKNRREAFMNKQSP
jgi:hypothetical protein